MILTYDQLGSYIGKQATDYFNKYYSSNTNDYIEEIKEEFIKEIITNDYESTICSDCHIELTQTNKQPLIIQFKKETNLSITGLVIDEKFII